MVTCINEHSSDLILGKYIFVKSSITIPWSKDIIYFLLLYIVGFVYLLGAHIHAAIHRLETTCEWRTY